MSNLSPAKSAKARNKDASCQAILDGAERCFVAKGFDGASMSAIGREAGVTQSLIHYHFHNKENLWNEVKRRRLNACFSQQKQLLEKAADENVISQIITLYFRTLQNNPSLTRLLGWKTLTEKNHQKSQSQDDMLEMEVTRLAVARISHAQQQGIIRDDLSPSYLVVSMFALVTHWFNSRENYFNRPDLDINQDKADEEYLNTIIQITLQGILITRESK